MAAHVKSVTRGSPVPPGGMARFLVAARKGLYTVPHEEPREKGSRRSPQRKSPAQAETIAFMLLAGVGLGLGVGYVIDRLAHTLPWFTSIGVFVGFGVALYAVYLETR